MLAVLVHRLGTPLQPRERLGAAVAVSGLALLGVSLTVHVAVARPAHSSILLIVIAAGATAAGLLAAGAARGLRPAASLGAAAGLLFGVGDLATKGAVSGNGVLFIPLLAICTALGFVSLQMAFQRGRVLETAGLATLVNNMIPIFGGLAVFHESLPGGWAGAARVTSYAAVVFGAVLLAHAPPDAVKGTGAPDPPGILDGTYSG